MKIFGALGMRLRGVRGIEWLAALVALSLLGLAAMNWNLPGEEEDARTELERRLESVLGAVEGAGRVRVMISEDPSEAVSAFSGAASGGRVRGVLVVAEGAGDLRVRMALAQAVPALLDVELANIEIAEMRRD